LTFTLAMAGCSNDPSGDPASSTTLQSPIPTGFSDPRQTVDALLEALAGEQWEDAARMTVGGQMALVALAEGAEIETVSDYLQLGEVAVGVNFWAGFTRVAEEFLAGTVADLRVVSDRSYQAGGAAFVDLRLASSTSPDGHTFKLTVARSDDFLWRVDVIATFVDVLALRLSETAEIIRATRTEDAAVVAAEMMRHVPSLEAVLTDPDLTAESSQATQAALAAIR
jgi:hypothetical protein